MRFLSIGSKPESKRALHLKTPTGDSPFPIERLYGIESSENRTTSLPYISSSGWSKCCNASFQQYPPNCKMSRKFKAALHRTIDRDLPGVSLVTCQILVGMLEVVFPKSWAFSLSATIIVEQSLASKWGLDFTQALRVKYSIPWLCGRHSLYSHHLASQMRHWASRHLTSDLLVSIWWWSRS